MARDVLRYKGYMTRVLFDAARKVLYGKVEGIVDWVEFECDSARGAEQAFHDRVDAYLDYCAQAGRRPATPYKGQFSLRISPELHRSMSLWAMAHDVTLTEACRLAMVDFVGEGEK